MGSKKTIFTLNLNGYAPEITDLTYPLIEAYARKIGAGLYVITERKFPEWPLTYEKLQIFELAQQMNNDWNIYIDSDTLVHPDTPDLTAMLPRDTVGHFWSDLAPVRWRPDRFFERDGRNIGSGNWLAVASNLCVDLWRPLDDMTPQEAIANIFPTVAERRSAIIDPSHLIDDYVLSRNIAKFGLKFKRIKELFSEAGFEQGGYFFYHHYLYNTAQKVAELKKAIIRTWGIYEIMGYDFSETPVDKAERIPGWMTREELEWLYEKAKTVESVVEIGSFKGRSTFVLASGCNGDKGHVWAIDPFTGVALACNPAADGKPTFDDFMRNVGHFPHLTPLKMTSQKAATSEFVPAKVDMVFIDGDHSFTGLQSDLHNWAPRATKLLCGHDLDDPNYPGVRQALQSAYGADRIGRGPGSIWYIQ